MKYLSRVEALIDAHVEAAFAWEVTCIHKNTDLRFDGTVYCHDCSQEVTI